MNLDQLLTLSKPTLTSLIKQVATLVRAQPSNSPDKTALLNMADKITNKKEKEAS